MSEPTDPLTILLREVTEAMRNGFSSLTLHVKETALTLTAALDEQGKASIARDTEISTRLVSVAEEVTKLKARVKALEDAQG